MHHHPTNATRMISIFEAFIDRATAYCQSWQSMTPDRLHQPRRIDLPVQKAKVMERSPKKRRVTVAIENIANHRPRSYILQRQFLQFLPSMNSYLKAEGNLEQIRRTRTSMKGIIGLPRKLPSEKGRIKFSYQSLEGARFRDKFPPLNVIQTGNKSGRSQNAPPYDQRCSELT